MSEYLISSPQLYAGLPRDWLPTKQLVTRQEMHLLLQLRAAIDDTLIQLVVSGGQPTAIVMAVKMAEPIDNKRKVV